MQQKKACFLNKHSTMTCLSPALWILKNINSYNRSLISIFCPWSWGYDITSYYYVAVCWRWQREWAIGESATEVCNIQLWKASPIYVTPVKGSTLVRGRIYFLTRKHFGWIFWWLSRAPNDAQFFASLMH